MVIERSQPGMRRQLGLQAIGTRPTQAEGIRLAGSHQGRSMTRLRQAGKCMRKSAMRLLLRCYVHAQNLKFEAAYVNIVCNCPQVYPGSAAASDKCSCNLALYGVVGSRLCSM